jgi:CDP-6-deoxy-D-xylo-4-hexulose-3-dehydrase
MQKYEGRFILPVSHRDNDPIWFGYPLTIPDQELYWGLVEHLIENKIEIRPLFSGNILAHPAYQPWKDEIIKGSTSTQSDLVLQGGLFLPAWNDEQSPYVAEALHEFMRNR